MQNKTKINWIKGLVYFSLAFSLADFIYRIVNNISFLNRDKCILYQYLSRIPFLIFENFIELGLFVVLALFLATLAERYFVKYKFFFPKNPYSAFLYASIIPVCSCSAIPIVKVFQDKINFRTLITFIVAAPLLNPYIIFISFSVLGWKYAVLRIVSSFILSVSAGYVLELFRGKNKLVLDKDASCDSANCRQTESDIYLKTWNIFKSILPYLLVGGMIGLAFEIFVSKKELITSVINNSIWGNVVVILIGIPLYLCNGADVVLLKPLVCSGIALGTAIAFSMTTTAICVTSIVMLFKVIGKKLTAILIAHIFIVTLLISQIINWTVPK